MKRFALLAVAAGGCLPAVPETLVLCHNANCAGSTDPWRDGTLPALRESLALRNDGRPTIDGVEIDIMWDAAHGRCVFGHDLGHSADGPDAVAAIDEVAAFLASTAIPAWNGRAFVVKIEMKPEVTVHGRHYTDAESPRITGCGLDIYEALDRAADMSGHRVVVYFDADIALLTRMTRDPRWPGRLEGERVELRFNTNLRTPLPPGFRTDAMTLSVDSMRDGLYTELHDAGIALVLVMFDATSETFHAISELQPEIVSTNEAPLVRRWLNRAQKWERGHRVF